MKNSFIDAVSITNQQICSQEELNDYLAKAKALIQVALGDDFLNYEKFTINNFLWAISDVIDEASALNESLLNTLLKNNLLQIPNTEQKS